MKRSLVHLMLGFLICITSLQGVAAELLACCRTPAPAHSHTMAGADACHHAEASGAAHAHHATGSGTQHAAHAGQACAACLACCGVPVALPAGTVHSPLFQVEAGFQPRVPAPAGHIPDTPERPPRPHAA
jgi:hypothetical protein